MCGISDLPFKNILLSQLHYGARLNAICEPFIRSTPKNVG
jgi:hypothetical protein